MKIKIVFCVVVCLITLIRTADAAGRIEIERFVISPTQIDRDASFEVSVKVKATDVPIVSYVLRTSRPMTRDEAPAFLDFYNTARNLAYLQEDGQVNLLDNGIHDLDPDEHAFRIRIDTKDWPEGKHDLVLFAHNRPGNESQVKDQHLFSVIVDEDRVRVVDQEELGEDRLTRCDMVPSTVNIGEEATLHLKWSGAGGYGIELRQPYYVRPEQSPSPFTYDAKHVSSLLDNGEKLIRDNGDRDLNPEAGAMALTFDTTGWQPGSYYLEITLPNAITKSDMRHIVLNVRSPKDGLDVRVSPSWPMMPGTHADRLTRLADGTLIHTSRISTDEGKTWQVRDSGTIGIGAQQLRSGHVLGMDYRKLPIEGREGWYSGEGYTSTDGGRTVSTPFEMQFHVPQAKAAQGHALHPGPLYMRSIVERTDGSLVALMAGWFKGDDTPCPYNPKRPYSRTYTCESQDGGKTWDYLSTIGYDHIGSEGYNEGVMETLPDGRLIAVMRTGSMSDPKCQDNPIMVSTSDDGGATWSKPRRTGAHGAFPDLAVLSDGTLALSYGRPGANIAFSRDNGLTWGNHTSVDPTPYSGYTSISEISPGEILMAFGTKGRIDPRNGDRSDGIRMARIQFEEQGDVNPLASLNKAGVSVVALGDGFYDCTFYSKSLESKEQFALHLPEDYTPNLPLIVFLHGSGRHHLSLIEMPQSRDVIRNSSAVFLSPKGSESWWVNSPVDKKSQYESYLEECIALVTEHLAVSRDPKNRAIGGWSMGGFGSVNYAEKHPNDFGAWAGILALLDFPNADYEVAHNHSVPTVLGNESQQATFNPLQRASALQGMNVMIITADSAFDCRMNETFAATLTRHEIPHSFTKLRGSHTMPVVQKAFPQVMEFFHTGFNESGGAGVKK